MDEASTELNIQHVVRDMMKSWWLMVGLSLVGALAGFLFSLVRAPIYEAKAVLGVNIVYGVTDHLALVVEDRALSRVASLVLADWILEGTLDEIPAKARDERGWEKPADLRSDVRLERRLAEWHLVVSDTDPQIAAQTAQSWAEITLEAFDEASEHSFRAVTLLAGGGFLVDCEEEMKGGVPLDVWQCYAIPQGVEAENLDQELLTEIELSHGVLPNMTYELLQEASPPEEPILWRRSWLILVGLIAGLIAGALSSSAFTAFRKTGRKASDGA